MKASFLNFIYFSAVFLVSTLIAAYALTQRINRYQTFRAPITIAVQKDDVVVSSSVSGLVNRLYVQDRQFVKKDEIVAEIDSSALVSKLEALRAQTDNASAQAEALVLETQLAAYRIRAPRDGIMYKVGTTEGSFVNAGSPLAWLYANDNISLVAQVTEVQYSELKEEPFLNVYSQRFEQSYPVKINGIGRVVVNDNSNERKYELLMNFQNEAEGVAFLQGESLELLQEKEQAVAKKPSEIISDGMNTFVSVFQ